MTSYICFPCYCCFATVVRTYRDMGELSVGRAPRASNWWKQEDPIKYRGRPASIAVLVGVLLALTLLPYAEGTCFLTRSPKRRSRNFLPLPTELSSWRSMKLSRSSSLTVHGKMQLQIGMPRTRQTPEVESPSRKVPCNHPRHANVRMNALMPQTANLSAE